MARQRNSKWERYPTTGGGKRKQAAGGGRVASVRRKNPIARLIIALRGGAEGQFRRTIEAEETVMARERDRKRAEAAKKEAALAKALSRGR